MAGEIGVSAFLVKTYVLYKRKTPGRLSPRRLGLPMVRSPLETDRRLPDLGSNQGPSG